MSSPEPHAPARAASCRSRAPQRHAPVGPRRRRRALTVLALLAVAAVPVVHPSTLTAWAATPVRLAAPATGAPSPVPTPVPLLLTPALTRPQPGDSARTRAARTRLAALIAAYQDANQRYDLARERQAAAQAALTEARRQAAAAQAAYDTAHQRLIALVVGQYLNSGGPVSVAGKLLVSDSQTDLLSELALAQQVTDFQAGQVQATQAAERSRDAARARVATLAERAARAVTAADRIRTEATRKVAATQKVVASLHSDDVLAAAAAALRTAAISPAAAATAMRAQTLATGAASETDYRAATTPAAVILVAARAMLEQAAGLRPAPRLPTRSALRFTATDGTPVDEQAVMGPAPQLGGIGAYKGATGTAAPKSLTPFDGVISHANWPDAGVGIHVPGTAKLRPANGVTVHPALPAPPKGRPLLRAEIAVETALAQLGAPYVWDAAGPDTFDCSGLTLYAWGHAGVPLGHFTGLQVKQGRRVAANELLPGDLVLFGASLHHVGLYLGAGYMINAPDTGEYVSIAPVAAFGDYTVAVRP